MNSKNKIIRTISLIGAELLHQPDLLTYFSDKAAGDVRV
jgi:hypothetical protein